MQLTHTLAHTLYPPLLPQMKALLHAADISNPVRPFRSALSSVNRVHAEFEMQAAAERAAGLPETPHMAETSIEDRANMEVCVYVCCVCCVFVVF